MSHATRVCAAAAIALVGSPLQAQTDDPGNTGPPAPPASEPEAAMSWSDPTTRAADPAAASAAGSGTSQPSGAPRAETTRPKAPPSKIAPKQEEEGPAIGFNWNGFWLTPLIAPGYSPELHFLIGGGLMASWKADEKSPRSSIPVVGAWGSVGALVIQSQLRSYWLDDRLRIDSDFWVKNLTDQYFGVGYDAGLNTPQGEETTQYHRRFYQVAPTILNRVAANLFVGLAVDWNYTSATKMNPRMQMDAYVLATGPDNDNLGVGPALRWDSRDYPQNAYKGVYAQLSFIPYFLDNDYQILELDYRHYIPIGRPGSTLATQLYTRNGWGTVPWSSLSFVGSPYDLRGYRWGRFRDNTAAWALAEYRYTFLKLKKNRGKAKGEAALSRHGLVGWVGVGTLGPKYTELAGVLPNGGAGYRFALQNRLNARLDFGVGRDSRGFYFSFTEAF